MKYIGDVDTKELDIKTAMNMANKGIDVFNPKDDFFNNICKQIDDINSKDMILNDRRKDIFKNATFCQNGSSYTGINYNLMVANCLCDSYSLQIIESSNSMESYKSKQNQELNFDSIKKNLLDNLFEFNIDAIKCYKLVFNRKILINNIGFYSMSLMFISQLIFLLIFFIKKLKPLKNFMLKFNLIKSMNIIIPVPCKSLKSIKQNILYHNQRSALNTNSNEKIKRKVKIKIKIKKKKFVPKLKNKIKSNIIPYDEISIDKTRRKLKLNESKENEYNLNNILLNNNLAWSLKSNDNLTSKHNIYKKENFNTELNIQNKIYNKNTNSEKEFHHMKALIEKNEDKNIKSSKDEENIINLTLINEDLQDMDYENSLIKDKRSFLKIYWSFLVDKLIILETFFTDNYLNLFIIKLSFFKYVFQISFFLNALFYTDEYISKSYHNNGILDFISGLPKSFYSFIATLILTNLLQILSNNKSELIQTIRKFSNNIDYTIIIENKLRKLRNKLIAYYAFVFLLGLFFLYYVTSFCATYRHSQKY